MSKLSVKERKGSVNKGFAVPALTRAVFSIMFASDKPESDEGFIGFKCKAPANTKINGIDVDSVKFVQPVSSLVLAEGEPLFTKNGTNLELDENPALLISTSSKGIRFEKK